MLKKDSLFLLIFSLFLAFSLSAQDSDLLIQNLTNKDAVFKRFTSEVEMNYRRLAQMPSKNEELSGTLIFYKYVVKTNEDFFSLSSRFNVGQETLATVNHISTPNEILDGKTLFVPNCKGLFLTENEKTPFEILLKQKCGDTKPLAVFDLNGEKFAFFPDYQVGMTERSFFLDSSLKMPLAKSVLTSEYGMRVSPISGKPLFHKGIDLAAPVGTEVLSCGAGEVVRTGSDGVYGNYIEIKHLDGKFSFYAHLSKIDVRAGTTVRAGTVIGKVGTTGLSTGPHLHFEIRQNNKNVDPLSVVSE